MLHLIVREHLEDFLRTNVWVGAHDRARLEQLFRYLEKLAALTPRPTSNLVFHHGVLAPHARWRPDVVAYRRQERDQATVPDKTLGTGDAGRPGAAKPRY